MEKVKEKRGREEDRVGGRRSEGEMVGRRKED